MLHQNFRETCNKLDWNRLPSTYQKLKKAMGAEATLILAMNYAGSRIYIPLRPGKNHHLSKWIGLENARALAAAYPQQKMEIPKLDALNRQLRETQIREANQRGTPPADLAKEFKLSPRRIWQILANNHQ